MPGSSAETAALTQAGAHAWGGTFAVPLVPSATIGAAPARAPASFPSAALARDGRSATAGGTSQCPTGAQARREPPGARSDASSEPTRRVTARP